MMLLLLIGGAVWATYLIDQWEQKRDNDPACIRRRELSRLRRVQKKNLKNLKTWVELNQLREDAHLWDQVEQMRLESMQLERDEKIVGIARKIS